MGLDKKLQKQFDKGLLTGYQDTWQFFEEAMKQVPGIGEKRRSAILDKVAALARERHKVKMNAKH